MNTIFTKVPKTIGVSGFRAALADNLAKAKKAPLIISDRKGGDTFVVISLDAYNELVEIWVRANKIKNK
ncbi:type II toxin-antitoxin system Phd/YefM family antitoxin [bacterium]|nr:MAG: type II toxin-antitoxin system Phd/YefM family antitoxin [bacterium]